MHTFRKILTILIVTALLAEGGCSAPDSAARHGSPIVADRAWLEGLEGEARWIESGYFDRAMGYTGSRFRVISLTRLVERFGNPGTDAVLLDCFDDYEGLLPVDDIRRYDLQLALELEIDSRFPKPDWLNPMMVVVPDGSGAPNRERYMTANIRALRFVNLADYYRPITKKLPRDETVRAGFAFFQDNCLFCHGLEGVGGNKGTPLLKAFDFKSEAGRGAFKQLFAGFHHADNPDKQNMEQFVVGGALDRVADFLAALQ